MAKGKIKWFNETKGFGFIEQEDGGKDVFVHTTSLVGDKNKLPKEGDEVEFSIQDTPKGLSATECTIVQ